MAEQVWNHHFIQANGIRLHYVRQGAGMPLVLLHGWPEFWWKRQDSGQGLAVSEFLW